ncbi:MAG: hypothetical protein WBM32_00745, partial [Crocosphaera sp.]
MKKNIINRTAMGIVIYGITLLMGYYSYDKLDCTRLEKDYVMCRKESQKIRNLYGIFSQSNQEFRLKGTQIKETEHRNEDGIYYTYHLYLSSNTSSALIYFAEYKIK